MAGDGVAPARRDGDGLARHLDARAGLGPEIADPDRIARRAAVRGEDHVAPAVSEVSDRVDPACARLGAGVVSSRRGVPSKMPPTRPPYSRNSRITQALNSAALVDMDSFLLQLAEAG